MVAVEASCAREGWPELRREGVLPTDELPSVPASGLDRAVLRRLVELEGVVGEPGWARRLFDSFLTALERRLSMLRDALESSRAQAVGESAHALASDASSIGALRLAYLCSRVDLAVRRTAPPEELRARVDALCAEAAIVACALRELLERETA